MLTKQTIKARQTFTHEIFIARSKTDVQDNASASFNSSLDNLYINMSIFGSLSKI